MHEGDNRHRIVSTNPHPDDERWQFNAGDVVVCEQRRLSEGDGLVAVRLAQ
jgi:hypothetical protein